MEVIYNKVKKNKYIALFILYLFISPLSLPAQRTFVHPGLSHTLPDLERMKSMVDAKIDPWYTSYQNLLTNSQAKYTYVVKGDPSFTTVVQDGTNFSAMTSDVKAAYLNALMWCITKDSRYAEKAIEIFNAWKNLTSYETSATESLDAGRMAWQLIEAAEIIKSTYSGWSNADIQAFKNMLVYPGYSNTIVPSNKGTFYWHVYMGDSGRHGNQDLFGYRVVMAMGVFLDNEIMYERAYRYITGQTHRADDFEYPAGPPNNSSTPSSSNDFFDSYTLNSFQNTIPDYGYNGVISNYIWENGQCEESSRDQDHAVLGVGMVASLAEIAWNQGDDVYSIYNNRILKGYEWALRYNVSYKYSFDDQSEPWEPTVESGEFIQRRDRSGRWLSKKVNPYSESDFVTETRGDFKTDKRPIYEMALAQYEVRAGLPLDSMKWTKRAMEISNDEIGYEQSGWSLDHLGWGGLTFHRTAWMAGDPVSYSSGNKVLGLHKIPDSINAVDYDYYTGNGQNHTFYDITNDNTSNGYRPDSLVDIVAGDSSYVVSKMETGEWLSYTIDVPRNGLYSISVRAKVGGDNVKLKFVIDDDVEIEKVFSVTSQFEEINVGDIALEQGCKVLRVYVTGESNEIELSRIRINFDQSATPSIQLAGSINSSNNAVLNWEYWNLTPDTVAIYRSETDDFSSSTLLANNLTDNIYTDNTIVGSVSKYYYWVTSKDHSVTTISNKQILSWGAFYDEFFDTENSTWNVSSGTGIVVDSSLYINYNSYNSAVLAKSGGVTLHAGNYPILAIRAKLPAGTTIAIHNATTSSLGGGTNKYTGVLNNEVYYYDLTQIGFVKSGTTTMVPTTAILTNTTFQVRLTSTSSDSTKLMWIGTFKDLTDLKNYYNISGVTNIEKLDVNYSVKNNTLYLSQLESFSQVELYDVTGLLVYSTMVNTGSQEIKLLKNRIYILRVRENGKMETIKIIN